MRGIVIAFLLLFSLSAQGQFIINSYRFGAPAADLLLDSFPGAGAAYSLRLLDKDYTGNCIMVRRSNGDSTNIGFVNNYLDTVSLKSFCGTTSSDTCYVRTWYDQSGNSVNVRQTTSANQPYIVRGGAITYDSTTVAIYFNGFRGLQTFNGALQPTIADTYTVIRMDTIPGVTDYSVQAIINFAEATTHTGGLSRLWLFLRPTTNLVSQIRQNGNVFNGTNSPQHVRYLFNLNSKLANVYRNNTSILSTKETTDLTYPNSAPFLIGNIVANFNAGLIGYFQETIIYTSDNSTNRTAIQTNINNFYQIY
jgi:hypothetical protein